jgi:hypothetical protein
VEYYETKDGQKLPCLALPDGYEKLRATYWRPNPGFLAELANYLQGRKVLEIFAGNGHLAGHLSARGVSITATSVYSAHDLHEAGLYHPVTEMDAIDAVAELGDDHDVLLVCWPTTTGAVFRAAEQWGTEKDIVFIGEVTDYTRGLLGGCATDRFFEHITQTRVFSMYETTNMLESAFVCRFREEHRPLPGKDAA